MLGGERGLVQTIQTMAAAFCIEPRKKNIGRGLVRRKEESEAGWSPGPSNPDVTGGMIRVTLSHLEG